MITITVDLIEKKLGDQVSISGTGNYAFHYEVLLRWFGSSRFWTADDVMFGALAVYGWMPRILEVNRPADQCLTREKAQAIAHKLNNNTAEISDLFVNRSIPGTSKFLHFWRPTDFAIWDSRVKRALLGAHAPADSLDLYCTYNAALKAVALKRKKSLRELEQHLFLLGGQGAN